MTPEQATFLAQFSLGGFENEMKTTKRVIAAVPEDKADFRSGGEPSRSAKDLVWHLVLGDEWFFKSFLAGSFVWEGETIPGNGTIAEAVEYYEKKLPPLIDQVKALPPEKWAAPVDFFGMFKWPMAAYCTFLNNHSIHHRGQLSAYLRPMGAKVPSIYGGSADEPMAM